MQIVIDIPRRSYDRIRSIYGHTDKNAHSNAIWGNDAAIVTRAIICGKVLPKGHGRLIDTDALKTAYGVEGATKYGNESKEQLENSYSTMMMYEIADMLDYAPAIIEADEEGAEE